MQAQRGSRPDPASGYRAEHHASASLGAEWSEKFRTEDPRGDVVVPGTGVTYRLTKNV